MEKKYYTLTNPQKSIYLTEEYYKGTNINNIAGTITINQSVQFDKLTLAIKQIIKQNDGCRIMLSNEKQEIKQWIAPYQDFEIKIVNVQSEKELSKLARKITDTPFLLYNNYLFKFVVYRFPNNYGGFIINMHHIIADSWSMGIAINEIMEIYSSYIKDKKYEEKDINLYSYTNYIETEQEYKKSDKYQKDKAYWNEFFSTIPDSATIPSIQTKATTSSSNNALREKLSIPSDLLKSIKEYCNNNKVSVYNFLIAIFSIYISKVTSSKDFCIGTPILNRANFKEKNTTGMFINTLPIRVKLDSFMPFKDFVNSIMANSMALLRHQKYSYQNIIEDLRKKQSNLPALYKIMISYQITKMNEEQEEIPHETTWLFNGITADDIDIHIFDLNDTNELSIAYDYKTEKYTSQEMKQIHNRILNIISQILNEENIVLSDIEIITPKEKNVLINDFNNTRSDYPKNKTVIELFEEQAKLTPDNLALIFENKNLTYRKLNEKANQLAHYLVENGVKNNDIISVCMNKNISFIITILGVLKCGCAYLPINPTYPSNRINYIVTDSNSKIFITDTNYEINSTKTVVFDNIDLKKYEKSKICININSNDLAYVIYTSGSTGNPKGVMVTHKNLANFLFSFNNCFKHKFGNKDNCLSLTNISFDVSVCEIFTPLTFGATLTLYPENTLTSIPLLCEILRKNKITFLYIPPSVLNDVADFIISNNLTVYINKLLVGVEAIKNSTLNKFLKINKEIEIINGYGPTETTICTTFYKYKYSNNLNENVPIGYPISNSKIYILDKEDNLMPIGVMGELCVSGDNVSKGYLNNAELTNKSFIHNEKISLATIYKTGDLAYWTEKGTLSFIGRNDSQIKFKGHRIELNEINTALKNISNITNSYTMIKKVNNIDSICSYITTNGNINIEDIYENISNNLPYYMIPSHIIPLDSFPLTLNGKIDKNKLPEIIISTSIDNTETNYDETERLLVNIICKLLNIENVHIQDDLFELGLDSLSAIKLVTEIFNVFNITILIKNIFENASIKKLSKLIKSLSNTDKVITIPKVKKQEYYPVSSAQKRMYYASSLDNNSLLYNIAGGIILDKQLNIDKLEQCFRTIINRHESLRTYFEIVNGTIVQKILDKIDFKLEFENSNSDDIDKLFNDFVKPFNLNKAPLFNAKLVKLSNSKCLLLLNMHHIISDGTSLSILIDELCKLYNNESNLPELTISYKDFAVWENKKLNANEFNNDKEYWVNEFNDEIPVLNMPTNYTRPSMQSFEGDNVFLQIDSNLTLKLNELSKQLGITPYMLLLSAYYILLYKYTGQNDIVVGSPIVGRDNIQLSNIIGMFVNSLALRNKIDSSMSYKDFVKEIKNNCLNAFEHQTYPFDELVNALEIKRDTSRNPLFDTMFIYQNNGNVSTNFEGIKSEIYMPKTNIAKFDLSLEIIPENNVLNLRFEYCSKLFNKDFINKLSKHYLKILQTIINDNDIKISNIDMLTEKEKEQILYNFNDTKVDYPKDKTVIQLFEEQVEKNPNGIAIIFEEQKITYKELNEKANQLAYCLLENGVKNNDIVSVCMNKNICFIISILATLKCGCAYLPINPTYPINRINYIVSDSHSKIFITDTNYEINTIKTLTYKNIDFSKYKKNKNNKEINCNDLAYVIYTSGSTGNPKGVMVTHRNLVNFLFSFNNCFSNKFGNKDNCLSLTNISFDVSVCEIFTPLIFGATLTLYPENTLTSISLLCEILMKNKITFLYIPPSVLNDVADFIITNNIKVFVNKLLVGVEAIKNSTLNKFLEINKNIEIINGYGPTETTICTTFYKYKYSNNLNENVPIGYPISNSKIFILDKDNHISPIGVIGELCVSGDNVSKGYLNNTELTNKSFIYNKNISLTTIYKTGDLAYWTQNGALSFIGRNDSQIKFKGHRIELNEINTALKNISNITNSYTMIRKVNNIDSICSFITSDVNIDLNNVYNYLKKNLPYYMIPSHIIMMDAFPLTLNGKIDKKFLQEYEITNTERLNYIPPENEIQKLFCNTWEKLLNTKVGINDNIFELGADSLLAIKFKVEMLANNVNVEYADIFKYPTVKELSEINSVTTIDEQTDSYDYTEINRILEKNNIKNCENILTNKTNNVLLLGANGFAGMHILYNFIKMDNGKIYCIVRDKNKLSARTRFLDTLHFYFNNELDKFIDNRIIILKGDITKEKFGLSTELYNDIVKDISIVINSSANVKHYGNIKDFENINIGLTKKAIEFCENYNKRLIQISTISVSGEMNKNESIAFSENNLYIGQKLDNVYIKSKFEAERIVLEHISKGLKAQILRLGNITNRYSDGKFQINSEENAFIARIKSFIKLGVVPDYLLNVKLEFTPVDLCTNAIISIMQNYVPDFSVFHIYNNNYITMQKFINILKNYNIKLKVVDYIEFNKIVKETLLDDNKKENLSGIINELNSDNNFEIHSNINILSEFTTSFLYTIDFNWSKIDNDYIEKYIKYFEKIKFI